MIATGVLAAVWLARKRFDERGLDPDDMADLAVWAVPAGLIGARLYHVITDFGTRYCGPPKCSGSFFWDAFKIWEGGLGIPGGIALGAAVGVWAAKRMGVPLRVGLDCAAPAIPLAQAIGRLGNWFNQELFGRPTGLPWGLEITKPGALATLPPEYVNDRIFHPTFLYEALWSLALMVVLLRIDRTRRLKPGRLFALYIFGYFLGRLWVESLRIDSATQLFGLRVNTVLSLVMIVIGLFMVLRGGPTQSAEAAAASLATESWTSKFEAAQLAAANSVAAPAGQQTVARDGSEDGSETAELVGDHVAEGGPQDPGPGAEVVVAESDEGDRTFGVDPDKGA